MKLTLFFIQKSLKRNRDKDDTFYYSDELNHKSSNKAQIITSSLMCRQVFYGEK